jgi:hypothetical protein
VRIPIEQNIWRWAWLWVAILVLTLAIVIAKDKAPPRHTPRKALLIVARDTNHANELLQLSGVRSDR